MLQARSLVLSFINFSYLVRSVSVLSWVGLVLQ